METDKHIVLSEMSNEEKQLVRNQLAKILESTYFNSAKQMKRFLEYVVEKTLAGQGNLLKQYTIGIEALEFPSTFDSDNNPVVRIMAGRVRSRLDEFYNHTSDNEITIIIKKGTYKPEFHKKAEDLLIPDVGNVVDTNTDDREFSSAPKVALISFSDSTQSTRSNRLLFQVTDVLAAKLSTFVLAKFVVYNPLSDKSESHKKHQDIDIDFKLSLYIQEVDNNKHELLCRLTDASEVVHWSEIYTIDADTPLADQESIFERLITMVVDMHQGKLPMNWARQVLLNRDNIPFKYRVIASYRHFYDNLDLNSFGDAVKACEEALERNSDDIIANIFLSDLCRRDYINNFAVIDSPLIKGVQYAEKATHLRQDSHEAHYVLGQILFSLGDWERSREEFVLSRNLNKCNAVVEFGCGFHYCLMGKWEEGLSLVKKAMSMSKNYPSWYNLIISLGHYVKGEYQEARTEAEKIVAPGFSHGPLARCIAYAQLGELDRAKNELAEIALRIPNLEVTGIESLNRFFGNKELTKKIWEGVEIAMKA